MARPLAACLGLLLAGAAGAAARGDILQNDPRYSPFAYILDYLTRHPGQPACHINEGYLNFTEDWELDPDIVPTARSGTDNIRRWPFAPGSQPGSPDVTQTLLSGLNAIPGAGANIFVAVSHKDCDGCSAERPYLKQALPTAHLHTGLPGDRTHGKSVQCTNGSVFLTQNGSLNLQTVGVTAKANTSLVFVETGSPDRVPPMYAHFRNLWQAVVADTGTVFPGGGQDSSGLEGMTTPAVIGGRTVSFYAGRRHAFVGPSWSDGGLSIPFPDNLYPPTAGELRNGDLRTVNWYDQIILDAGTKLAEGEAVTVDVYMFEIGEENPFVDNLARLVKYGFVDCPVPACPTAARPKIASVSKTPGAVPPVTAFPGRLTVNVHYQFQHGGGLLAGRPTLTHDYLNAPVVGGSPAYTMTVRKVWQGFRASRMPGNPDAPFTPQDMHLKVAVLTSGQQIRLYVATSNLDMPDQGSGRKWQAGNIIDTAPDDDLFRLYVPQFRSIADDGDLSQHKLGRSNTAGNSHFDPTVRPTGGAIGGSGIAAFVFPLETGSR